jgi:hypothetical protein
MRLRLHSRQKFQLFPPHLILGATVLAVWTLAGQPNSQTTPQKNVVHGVVVSGVSRLPVEDVIAIARGIDGRSFGPSEPTAADGEFSLVVPEDESGFRLDVHDEQVRYLDYYPEAPFANKTHPHDFGHIVIYNPHELSLNDIPPQMESASLLHSIGDNSAARLMDKVAALYFESRSFIYPCPSLPSSIAVDYGVPATSSTPILETIAFAVVQKGDDLNSSLSPQEIATSQLNARFLSQNMASVAAAEKSYFEKTGSYGDWPDLIKSKLVTERNMLTPAGCTDILLGKVTDGNFSYLDQKPPYSYYLLAAMSFPNPPAGANEQSRRAGAGKIGSHELPLLFDRPHTFLLICGPDGTVRYVPPDNKLVSIKDAKPISPDFPLGIRLQIGY